MALLRVSIDEKDGQVAYSIENQFKDKQDFINFISKFQPKANELGLAIQLVEVKPPSDKVVLL